MAKQKFVQNVLGGFHGEEDEGYGVARGEHLVHKVGVQEARAQVLQAGRLGVLKVKDKNHSIIQGSFLATGKK